MRKIKRYGWVRDLPHNHKEFSLDHPFTEELPLIVDLRPACPPVYDQGELGSCTANGIAAAIQFVQPKVMPSRLFIYYNERTIEGDVEDDGGAQIHDGIKSIHTQGACSELEWPYDINAFAVKPPDNCYADALKDLITDYSCIRSMEGIKQALHKAYPVVFGMTVYESFESIEVAKTGMVPMPADKEEMVGGHCMLIVGYDDNKECFIVRNSWGPAWGLAGYCYLPYAYVAQYASDFWSIE